MEASIGEIVKGKVTGITKFGAFVSLDGGKSGLVHISEVASTYVTDVNEHLKLGDEVSVKILSIVDGGKINLSIKQAQMSQNGEAKLGRSETAPKPKFTPSPKPQYSRPNPQNAPTKPQAAPASSPQDSFEDKLKQFMQESDSRISSNKMYGDKKGSYRRRRD